MKYLAVILLAISTTGCASMEWLTTEQNPKWKSYDPCITCGEKWDQIPNSPYEAQRRRERGERW